MNIKNKINFSFVVTFVFVAVISTVLVGFFTIKTIRKNINVYLHSSNRARAEHVRTFIQMQERESVILAAASIYRDFLKENIGSKQYLLEKEKISKRLIRTLDSDPDINESFILNKNGIILASSDIAQEGKDKSTDDYFINARDKTYFKDVYYSNTTNEIDYTISSPVLDDNGDLLGVSVLRYSPDNFFSIVGNENGLGDTEENFLVNKDKLFITPSRFLGEDVILKQKVDTENVNNCFDQNETEYVKNNGYSGILEKFGSQIVEAKDYRNVDVLATHSYIPETDWCLVTKADKSDLFSFQKDLIILLAVISVIALFFLMFIGYFVSKKITDPILWLITNIKKNKKGDFSFKTNIKSEDEIGVLSSSFDNLIDVVAQSHDDIEKKVAEQTIEISNKANQLIDQKSAVLNILEDVEKEKEKTESLANDLEKFKLAIDNASDQAIITDKEGIVIYGNRAVERITGFKPEEAIGKKAGVLWKLPMPIEYYKNMWDTIKDKKSVFVGEIQNKRKNGELYIANISISPVLDNQDNIIYFVAIEHDITKEKEIDKAKTEFVSLASHQLRTPLSAINWYTEMLLAGDAGVINEEQKKYLNEVSVGNRRMVDLVNSLLNVSRLDLGTFIVELEPVNIIDMSRSVLGELKPQIIEKRLKLEEVYREDIGDFNADKKLLRMVFQNLLSNAVKYSLNDGTVRIELSKVMNGETFGNRKIEQNSIAIKVSDSGIGISSNQQDKIFSKMFRADNARELETEGTGLGLYIVQSIVNTAGGMIWFESIEKKGTTFYVVFREEGMKKKEGTKKLD